MIVLRDDRQGTLQLTRYGIKPDLEGSVSVEYHFNFSHMKLLEGSSLMETLRTIPVESVYHAATAMHSVITVPTLNPENPEWSVVHADSCIKATASTDHGQWPMLQVDYLEKVIRDAVSDCVDPLEEFLHKILLLPKAESVGWIAEWPLPGKHTPTKSKSRCAIQ